MKNILVFFSILLFINSYSQQEYEKGVVKYGVNINKDIFDITKKSKNDKYPESIKASFKKLALAHKRIYASDLPFIKLTFSNNSYILEPVDVMIPENLKSKFIFQSDTYYRDIANNIYVKKFKKLGRIYIAPLINEKNDWEISNKSKNILGFKCRFATLQLPNNNEVIAWFTPQIPLAFSPIKINGLPGAILEVTTPLKHIYAKDIEFKGDVEVKKPTEGIKLTAEEYKQMMTRFKPD
jgi:GLPGLI family protein